MLNRPGKPSVISLLELFYAENSPKCTYLSSKNLALSERLFFGCVLADGIFELKPLDVVHIAVQLCTFSYSCYSIPIFCHPQTPIPPSNVLLVICWNVVCYVLMHSLSPSVVWCLWPLRCLQRLGFFTVFRGRKLADQGKMPTICNNKELT